MRKKNAFTLIELLIVVAIIAILAAIAVPNFLEAQTRSKASAVVAELRTVSLALESYQIDWNSYPVDFLAVETGQQPQFFGYGDVAWFTSMTTPLAYLSSVNLIDPFSKGAGRRPTDIEGRWLRFGGDALGYGFINFPVYRPLAGVDAFSTPPSWVLVSKGPDERDAGSVHTWGDRDPNRIGSYTNSVYDPTNGTVSYGDIVRWGP
jgi:prepilin-type N-terminal cleavage/methylation domain-containing protein